MVTEALGRVVRRAPRDHDRRRGPCRPLLLLLDDPRRMAHPEFHLGVCESSQRFLV